MASDSLQRLIELLEDTLTNKGNLPDPYYYFYWKNFEKGTIVINDEIDDNLIEKAILAYRDLDEDESVKEIRIILNTPGGSIYPGFALIDTIQKGHTPTIIEGLSLTASMGIYIQMCKAPHVKRVTHKMTVGLLHAGSTFLEGTTTGVKDYLHFSEHYEDKIRDYVMSCTNMTSDDLDRVERTELWMTADDMLKYGIVDEII